MRTIITALALSAMLTVEQRDPHRVHLAPPSAAVSADGRYIAFTTLSALAAADRDADCDVYVLDRRDHRVTFESAALENGEGAHPVISGDGRYLAYEAAGRIIFRDRHQDSIRFLGEGRQPSISADGRTVVFTSDLSGRIWVWNVQTGARTSIGGPASSVSPSASGDGRYIAFSAALRVFVHDRQTDLTEQIAAGWDPAISADGRHVAYVSAIGRLPNVFITDRATRTTQIISGTRKGRPANGSSVNPAISADGQVVVFQSDASNLLESEDFNLLWDVFLFDRKADSMIRVSGDPDAGWLEPSSGPALDESGRIVAFSSRHPTDAADKKNDFDLFVAIY